jgi:ribonuclease P protein component
MARANSLDYPRIGLAISKKNIKFSHQRNYIKRLIRESFRLRQNELPKMDFIVFAMRLVEGQLGRIYKSELRKEIDEIWFKWANKNK